MQQRGTGVVYPPAVLAAAAQRGWDNKDIPGYRYPLLYTASSNTALTGQNDLPNGWAYSPTMGIVTTSASSAPLERWNTNGRQITIQHANAIVRDNYITCDGRYGSAGNANGVQVATGQTFDNTLIEYNEMDGQGETGGATVFVGSISGTVLTVTSMIRGTIVVNMRIDSGAAIDQFVTSFGTGTGGVGTYNLSQSQSIASRTFYTRSAMMCAVAEHASTYHGGLVIRKNYSHGIGNDNFQINSSGTIIEDNRCHIGGWNGPLAHWDAIQIQLVLGTAGPIIVRGNYIDGTPGVPGVSPTPGTLGTTYGRTSTGPLASNCPDGVHYSQNIFGGAGARLLDSVGAMNFYAGYNNWGTRNRHFNNNVFEWGTLAFSPNALHETEQFNNNYRMLDASLMTYTQGQSQWMREDDNFWMCEDNTGWLRENA
jgi:hypothetical protein